MNKYERSEVGKWTAIRFYPGAISYDDWVWGWSIQVVDEQQYRAFRETFDG